MSRLLTLLRHAKSSWADPAEPDFDRPLADRGRASAQRMGRYLREAALTPDLVLCSSARRTRETLALVLGELGAAPQVRYEDRLYLATSDLMIALLRRLANPRRPEPAAEPGHVMIVGHNPGLQELAVDLAREGPAPLRRDLIRKFPTAGVAVIEVACASWADVAPGTGRLRSFVVPKRMVSGE